MSAIEEVEGRLRALENKVWIATGAVIVIAVWFGVNSIYVIPKMVSDTFKEQALSKANEQIQNLLTQAHQASTQIAEISKDGSIQIGGICFRPRMLVRCARSASDHMTGMDIDDECTRAGMRVETKVPILAQC